MELPFSNTLLLLISFLTLLAAIRILKIRRKSSKLPPGPWRLPIIGNLHQVVGSEPPHRRLMGLAQKHGPLMHLQLGETSNVIVSSPELAKEFMKTHDLNFAFRPVFPAARILSYDARDIAFAPHGEYWRQMRKVFTQEILSAQRVESLRPVVEDEIGKLTASIRQQKAVNLSRMFVSLGNTIVWRVAFGRLQKQEQGFMPVMLEMVKVFGGFGLGNLFPSSKLLRMICGTERFARKLHKEADVILEGIINEHIARRAERSAGANKDGKSGGEVATEDLCDALLNLKDDGKGLGFTFTNVEIKGVILDMFLGGSDTSTATVEWAMSELMRNPRVMEKAQKEVRRVFDGRGGAVDTEGLEELSYLKLVVKEAFRMHPPAPLLAPRECQKTVTIAGYEIPAKTRVMINILAIGRDPRHWTKPDEFYPERFLDRPPVDIHGTHFEFTPFGAGRRMCPGVLFGAALVELLLTHLLYHFDWKLPSGTDPQNLDMSECFGVVVRRNTDLHLISVPYQPKTVY